MSEGFKPDEAYWDALRAVDTPSIANAIEVALGRRQGEGFSRRTVIISDAAAKPMVGYARTAKLRAATPSNEPKDTLAERRMAYYRYMSEGPRPAIAVVEDLDWPDCVGAYWGEINTSVHKGFGLSGALTNGVMRDLDNLAPDFPVIAGSVGPSHAFVRVEAIDEPVTVFDLTIGPGDLIHADRHGAVVIPAEAAPGLPSAIARMVERERIVLDATRRPGFDFEAFKAAWTAFEAARE